MTAADIDKSAEKTVCVCVCVCSCLVHTFTWCETRSVKFL